VPAFAQAPPGLEEVKDEISSKRLTHYWADFKCLKFSDGSEQNAWEQCKTACMAFDSAPNPGKFAGHSRTCVYDMTQETWQASAKQLTPEEQARPGPRPCKCLLHV
jgi:hypothetical protein